jgi:aspartate aminotransferase-like enzyme
MWAEFAESYGLVVHRWSTSWEHDASADELAELLDAHPKTRGVTVAYGDTSTGVANDVAGVSRIARQHGALMMVDAVSSLGGMPFLFDEWDVDVAVTASQKCLMSSPGLAWVAMSDRAWSAEKTSRLPRNYWTFVDIKKNISRPRPETPGTPPVQIVLQVAEALRMMHEEGLANVYARHDALSRRAREGTAALGLAPQCETLKHRSTTLSALALPDHVNPKAFRDRIKAQGILTAAGLGRYESHGFRIGHMGDIRMTDVERTLAAVASALRETTAVA